MSIAARPGADALWRKGTEVALPQGNVSGGTNGWIRAQFVVSAADTGKRLRLESNCLGGNAVVFVNGTRVGEMDGPFAALVIDPYTHAGTNELLVWTSSVFKDVAQKPAQDIVRQTKLSWEKFPRRAGFVQPPTIRALSRPVGLDDAWIETSVREKKLMVKATLLADAAVDGTTRTVEVSIRDRDGRTVKNFRRAVPIVPGEQTVTLEEPWTDPRLWDIDDGYLYTATVRCGADEQTFRFGFREVWVNGRDMILNGHPLHLRIEMDWFKLTRENLGWFRTLGLNAYYLQAHPKSWFGFWSEVPDLNPRGLLDLCDEEGISMFLPVFNPSQLHGLTDRAEVLRECEEFSHALMKLYRRHPCVLAWCASLNTLNPVDGIHPAKIGRRTTLDAYTDKSKATLVKSVCDQVKALDPTRVVYTHADGSYGGEISTGNCYPNLTPAQEVWDYLEPWSQHGNMPYFACEYGTYWASYAKEQSKCYLTQYDAIYRGWKAFDEETDAYRALLPEFAKKNSWHGSMVGTIGATSSALDSLETRFQEASNKGWRAAGVLSWHHFVGADYGTPEKPNVHGRCNLKWMQKFLGFIGGAPDASDRTHVYAPGEAVRKTLVAMWDSSGARRVEATWRLRAATGKIVRQGRETYALGPFEIQKPEIALTPPGVGDYTLEADFRTATGETCTDAFDFSVKAFPKVVKTRRTVKLWDPRGESAWVRRLVAGVQDYTVGEALDPARDILVIGSRALAADTAVPMSVADVKRGLRVLVLEQLPARWARFGFTRNVDVCARNAFLLRAAKGALYEGLCDDDLAYWRGRALTTPEYRYTRDQPAGAPKGSNRHGVAATVFAIPDRTSYKPLFVCEFTLAYSPLLAFRCGKGTMVYNTLAFTGRVGEDPSASRVAANLFRALDVSDTWDVEVPDKLAERAVRGGVAAGFVDVPRWNILGPYPAQGSLPSFPFDSEMRRGELNPNIEYRVGDVVHDVRRQETPDGEGLVALDDFDGAGWAVGRLQRDEAGEAVLACNLAGAGELYLNGVCIADLTDASLRNATRASVAAEPARLRFKVTLNQGENVFAWRFRAKKNIPPAFAVKVSQPGFNLADPYVSGGNAVPVYEKPNPSPKAYEYYYW